jgi:penicillin-binding protein 1C
MNSFLQKTVQIIRRGWSGLGKLRRKLFQPRWKLLLWLLAFGIWWQFFLLPKQLFEDPLSMVLEDRDGNLLGARIAADGQWRFPATDTVPDKFAKAIVTFEDRRFDIHPGVDLISLGRATLQNLKGGRVVSGGSTLTMQVMRMSRKGQSRNVLQKAIEAVLALRVEMKYSKEEILAMYASNAPFGGNVVGLDAASWRYFGRGPDKLSWAESATLAVLPNSPKLIHPGRNRTALKAKRDRLLRRMWEEEIFDSTTYALAIMEPLPDRPHPLPNLAPHLLDRGFAEAGTGKRTRTTLDMHLQARASHILQMHQRRLLENGVHNAAALVMEVESGDVIAYVGNTEATDSSSGHEVDVIRARRSTGSILKPFLFASMLDDGEILPQTLVPDIPTYYGNYNPQNYNRTFDGAVPAKMALARSLNIPAIRMLSDYGHHRFLQRLQEIGMTTLDRPADDYGLSLILGGAEASLWDLAGMYASMARCVNDYHRFNGKYLDNEFRAPNFEWEKSITHQTDYKPTLVDETVLSAGSCYATLDALLELARPEGESEWMNFSSSRRVAWKTGTSYGYRDAWAVGVTPTHVVAVWAGNADGEGRPGLIGLYAAAPILFDLFDMIHTPNTWFDEPFDDMEQVTICKKSGHRASDVCDELEVMRVPKRGLNTEPCPYHKMVHLDPSGQFQVHGDCESPYNMVHKPWFVLAPAMEDWYRKKHVDYMSLPPWRADCKEAAEAEANSANMEFVYPRTMSKVYVPIDLEGNPSSVVFEVAHRRQDSKIHWHLDKAFIGTTETFHQMALNPTPGDHVITLVDEEGERLQKAFEVVGKR